jgi:hypothetical protein
MKYLESDYVCRKESISREFTFGDVRGSELRVIGLFVLLVAVN